MNGIFLFDFDKNNSKLFLDPEEGNKNIIYNDLKIDNSKRLWVGTSHKDEKLPEGSLWCINRDLSYKRIDTNFIVSNGPAFSKMVKTYILVIHLIELFINITIQKILI